MGVAWMDAINGITGDGCCILFKTDSIFASFSFL